MMSNNLNKAFLTIAKSNASYFPEAQRNDIVIGGQNDTQKILFGIAQNPSIMQISNSNIAIGGSFTAEMIAVGGQMIGTGTNVVFSPISTGWSIMDKEDPVVGIGFGPQRVQITNSLLQWQNTTTMAVIENQIFNSNSVKNILFQYDGLDIQEATFTKNNVSIYGKQVSQDIALASSTDTFILTGPSGMFTLGFDKVCTDIDFDESITFRCYYNKKTDNDILSYYYTVKGSQFINVMLPSFTQLVIKFYPSDNVGKSFNLNVSSIFRLTRLSLIE